MWIHRRRRAQENQKQRHCGSTAAKANPTGSCSATSLMSPLGSSDHVELFLCAKPAEGCSLTFSAILVWWNGLVDDQTSYGGLTGWVRREASGTSGAADTGWLGAVDQLSWFSSLGALYKKWTTPHCVLPSSQKKQSYFLWCLLSGDPFFPRLLSMQRWALGSCEAGTHSVD